MRRMMMAVLALVCCACLLAGCGGGATGDAADDKIKVVCSTFPSYDWARQVIGDEDERFELTLLLDDGVDLHSYQPTVEDIATVSDADLFVYVGGESDDWVADAVSTAHNPSLQTMSLMDELGSSVREEEQVEGMQPEKASGKTDEVEYDEHVWLSLRNASMLVGSLEQKIAMLDPDHASVYKVNAQAYQHKLSELDGRYAAMVRTAPRDTVLFGDRFPFRYLMADYGIDYYAAFMGCSAETEASFETITFLAKKIDKLDLAVVLVPEESDERLAKTIIESTKDKDARILKMDSLQSTSLADAEEGRTYLQAMEDDLGVLKKALT